MNNVDTIEEERMAGLAQARMAADIAKAAAGGPMAKAKLALSFGKKVSEHWPILAAAAFFDLLALIPVISVGGNICFGLLLFLYFGPKSKGNELLKIGLPMGIGTIADFFLSILPVNIAGALIRIALN